MFESIKSNLEPLKILAIVESEEVLTVYLFSKGNKIILPIPMRKKNAIHCRKEELYTSPPYTDSLERTVKILGGMLTQVNILHCKNENYYSYLRIQKNGHSFEIFCAMCDCICLAVQKKYPIYIKRDILLRKGIKVTKELIERSLIPV